MSDGVSPLCKSLFTDVQDEEVDSSPHKLVSLLSDSSNPGLRLAKEMFNRTMMNTLILNANNELVSMSFKDAIEIDQNHG